MTGTSNNTDGGIESDQSTTGEGWWSLLRAGSAVRWSRVVVSGLLVVVLFAGGAVAADGPVDIDPDTDLDGDGTETSPYIITNASELQAMRGNLTAHYELGKTINATNTSTWHDGDGFYPIGNHTGESDESFSGDQFDGNLDGNGYAVENLTIDRGDESYIGLFGYTTDSTTIGNVTLTNATVTGAGHVGALVGEAHGKVYKTTVDGTVTTELSGNSPNSDNGARTGGVVGMLEDSGTVANTTASVNVTGTTSDARRMGGLVGFSRGEIRDSKATGDVEGHLGIGGVIGRNIGHIENVTATGNVTGSNVAVGGLAGFNGPSSGTPTAGTITRSHATGSVNASDDQVGGLVGSNVFTVSKSYATGTVDGKNRVGGLVGRNTNSKARVSDSYATGAVNGSERIGGLVGYIDGGELSDSYATGTVTGTDDLGGLVGDNDGAVENAYWDTDATGVASSDGGEGLSTFEMTGLVAKDYMAFDYDNTWNATGLYPRLAWEGLDEPDPYPTATPGEREVWLLNDSTTGYYHNYSLDGSGDVRWLGNVVASVGADDTAQLIEIAAGNATTDYDTIVVGEGDYTLSDHEVNLTADGAGNLARLFAYAGSEQTNITRSGDSFADYDEASFRVDSPAATDLIIGDSGEFDANGDSGFYLELADDSGTLSPLIGVYNTADQFNLTVSNTTFGMWTNHGDTIILDDDSTTFNLELDVISHSGALINASAASSLSVTNSTIVEENDPRGSGLSGDGISFLKLEASGLDDVTVENVTIDSATEDDNVDGVVDIVGLDTSASVTIADLRIENTNKNAINVATEFESLSLSRLNLTDIGQRGVTISEDISSVEIVDSELTNTGTASIGTEASISQFNITGTTISDGNTVGIYIREQIGNATIANNTLKNTSSSPLDFEVDSSPSTPIEVADNYINGSNTGSLVAIEGETQINLTGNTLLNSGVRGVYLTVSESIISNNYIENTSNGPGIHLDGANDVHLIDNTVINTSTKGIHVDDATGATIHNATVDTTGSHGIQFTNGASGGELHASTITNTSDDALSVGDTTVAVTNLTLESGSIWADVTNADLNPSSTVPAGPASYQSGGGAINATVTGDLDNVSLGYDASTFEIDPRALDFWLYTSDWSREDSTVDTDAEVVAVSEAITTKSVLTTFGSNVSISAADTTVDAGESGSIEVTASNASDTLLEGVDLEVTAAGGLDGLSAGDTATTGGDGVATFSFQESSSGSYTVTVAWTDNTTISDTATVTVESTGGGGSGGGGGGGGGPPPAQSGTTVTVDDGSASDSTADDDSSDSSDASDASRPDTRISVTGPQPGQRLVIEGSNAYISTGEDDRSEPPTPSDGESGDDPSDDGSSNVRSDRLSVDLNTDRDFELSVTTYETDLRRSLTRGGGQPQQSVDPLFASGASVPAATGTTPEIVAPETVSAAAAAFERDTQSVSAGYLNVEHTLEPEEIAGATFEFSIRQSYLDALGVGADGVTLYHQVDGEWESRETEQTDADDTHYRFEGTMESFSVFALGTEAAPIGVTQASLSDESVETGETTTVSASVENRGQHRAEHTLELTADGEIVATEIVSLDGGEIAETTLSFESPEGEYAIAVSGTEAGTLTVSDGELTQSWLWLLIGLAVLIMAVLWRRSQQANNEKSNQQ